MNYKEHIKNLLLKNKEDVLKTNKNKSVISLVDILDEFITNYDLSSEESVLYIFDLFDLLAILLADSLTLQYQLYDKFTSIHNNMRQILHIDSENLSEKELNRYNLLKSIINKMENTMLRIYYNNPTEYDSNKEEFISYITFSLKNICFFKDACTKFPYLVNFVDKAGTPLVLKVLEHYLEALDVYLSKENLGPIDDLIYYDKVLTIILESDKIKIDDYNKKMMIDKINNYSESKNYTSNLLKEKLSFFTNSIINTILGIPNDLNINYLSYKYDIHTNFKEAHLLEAKKIYLMNKNIDNTKVKRKIYTFDGKDAKEIDDGLSLIYEDGIYHFGVHIADPTSYINYNSILMDEAKRRTTSRYIKNHCIPMFPFMLSGDLMSLNEGQNRYAISYYFDIDSRTGEIINFDVKNEIIKVERNLTYDYFDECLNKGTDDYEFLNMLVNLRNLSEILKRVYNEEKIYQEFHNDKHSSTSHLIVESSMIYTNYNIAKLFATRDLPFIYRCHEINKDEIDYLTKLQDKLKNSDNNISIIKDINIIKSMYPRAYCTSRNVGHFGLGVDYYSNSTSPLRRFSDNVSNMCIKKFLLGSYTKEDIKYMILLIDEISEIINSKRVSGDLYDMEYAKLMLVNKNIA